MPHGQFFCGAIRKCGRLQIDWRRLRKIKRKLQDCKKFQSGRILWRFGNSIKQVIHITTCCTWSSLYCSIKRWRVQEYYKRHCEQEDSRKNRYTSSKLSVKQIHSITVNPSVGAYHRQKISIQRCHLLRRKRCQLCISRSVWWIYSNKYYYWMINVFHELTMECLFIFA